MRLLGSRQPCNWFSCIEVITKRPSGDQVASRCEPFQSSLSGAAAVPGIHSQAPPFCAMAS